MRIAVPITASGQFNRHFGQSPAFAVFDIDDASGQIRQDWRVEVPEHGGCGAIPALLAREGVGMVIAGGMGAGAMNNLRRFYIEPLPGAEGEDARQIVTEHIAGRLQRTPEVCGGHHGHGHGHDHNHSGGGCCHAEEAK